MGIGDDTGEVARWRRRQIWVVRQRWTVRQRSHTLFLGNAQTNLSDLKVLLEQILDRLI